MIALVIFTDGRHACLDRTIASLAANLRGEIGSWLIFNDSPDPHDRLLLDSNLGDMWEIHHAPERRGFAGTIGHAWRILQTRPEIDHVAHWEDDFELLEALNLDELARVLDARSHLDQMALLRQAWNSSETAAGGIIEQAPENYTAVLDADLDAEWIEHRVCFTTNPCLYRREICSLGWPTEAHSEGLFTQQLLKRPTHRFAYWGPLEHGPWVQHIGRVRNGTNY